MRRVQKENGVDPDTKLHSISGAIETSAGKQRKVTFPNFSVEMETGTGKTYVYLRTAFELSRGYGLTKFIIVVPSVAIREGVLKTLQITEEHFRLLYRNMPYHYAVYDSVNLDGLRNFAVAKSLEILVMTIDSFKRESTVIRQITDRLQGEMPVRLVQAVNPILILDEPQNMESELSIRGLAALNPLFALRYSATHRVPYSLVFRLTPFDAYRQGLVKRIEVASVIKENDANQAFIRVLDIGFRTGTTIAQIALHELQKTGVVKERVAWVKPGDDLEVLTRRPEYSGFVVDEINRRDGFVRFANDIQLAIGEARGADQATIFEAQIRTAIEEHLQRQEKLRPLGIKVLSLFFVDRVHNYASKEGAIRKSFERSFDELKLAYPEWRKVNPSDVQAAYFAQKTHRTGVEWLDSKSGDSQEDQEAYNLIMKEKERLLSLAEPRAFIFTHSALREGWDNPNVFQICTLNQAISEIKKRQEVGRGMRLAVNQTGDQVRDERINVLTVVANESYQKYVSGLQKEIESEYGKAGTPPPPANARQRGAARLRKAYILRPEFQELWTRIKNKTRYVIRIDSDKLVAEVVSALRHETIRPVHVTVTKADVQVGKEDKLEAFQMTKARTAVDMTHRIVLPNLLNLMEELMERTTPPVRITRSTLLAVIERMPNKDAILSNPQEFATVAVSVIKAKLADHLVNGIRYLQTGEWYELTQLEEEIASWQQYLVPVDRSVYDHVILESGIEKSFVEDLERLKFVRLYWKLPAWFTVPTPVGEYNPDWAIVMEDYSGDRRQRLYLISETKSKNWKTSLRPSEQRKILCAEQHFKHALGVDYKVVTKAADLTRVATSLGARRRREKAGRALRKRAVVTRPTKEQGELRQVAEPS